jgi:hypothetical protein
MPKYYVESGDLNVAIDRPDPTTAVHDAFRLHARNCGHLGAAVQCNETGGTIKDDTVFFSTTRVLEATGLADLFVNTDEADSTST